MTTQRIKGIDKHTQTREEKKAEQLLNERRIVVSYFLCIVTFWNFLIEVQQSVTNSGGSLKSNQFFSLLLF